MISTRQTIQRVRGLHTETIYSNEGRDFVSNAPPKPFRLGRIVATALAVDLVLIV